MKNISNSDTVKPNSKKNHSNQVLRFEAKLVK